MKKLLLTAVVILLVILTTAAYIDIHNNAPVLGTSTESRINTHPMQELIYRDISLRHPQDWSHETRLSGDDSYEIILRGQNDSVFISGEQMSDATAIDQKLHCDACIYESHNSITYKVEENSSGQRILTTAIGKVLYQIIYSQDSNIATDIVSTINYSNAN